MKYLRSILVLLTTAAIIINFSHCGGGGGDDDPKPVESEKEKVTKLMTGSSWKIQTTTVGGVVHNELFQNFSITFNTTGFSTTNGDPVWPSSGTWSFTDDTAKAFTRSDGIVVTIEEISESGLVLSLTWTKTTLSGGRENSIAGKNVFSFGK